MKLHDDDDDDDDGDDISVLIGRYITVLKGNKIHRSRHRVLCYAASNKPSHILPIVSYPFWDCK